LEIICIVAEVHNSVYHFFILTPTGDPATRPRPVPEAEIELFLAGGQTDRVHRRAGQVDVLVELEDGDVVMEAGGMEVRVSDDVAHGVFAVFHRLRGIEPADIVFAHSHFQHAGKIQFIYVLIRFEKFTANISLQGVLAALGAPDL